MPKAKVNYHCPNFPDCHGELGKEFRKWGTGIGFCPCCSTTWIFDQETGIRCMTGPEGSHLSASLSVRLAMAKKRPKDRRWVRTTHEQHARIAKLGAAKNPSLAAINLLDHFVWTDRESNDQARAHVLIDIERAALTVALECEGVEATVAVRKLLEAFDAAKRGCP